MSRHRDILSKLDFNAVNGGDPIARAYFREAAIAIRVSEGDADHYRRLFKIEEGKAQAANSAARQLEDEIDRLRQELAHLQSSSRVMTEEDIGL